MPFTAEILVGAILGCSAGLYLASHLLVVAGFRLLPVRARPSSESISVIIAARNEEGGIGALLDDLKNQTRRPNEIIVVSDRSTDRTDEIVRARRSDLPGLRLERVDAVPAGASPKKHALIRGIERSSGEWLCFTDADCRVPSTWVEQLSEYFAAGTGMVVGTYIPVHSTGSQRGSWLLRFIQYEKFRNTLLGAGSQGLGVPWLASGSNLAYRRSVYTDAGGFASIAGSLGGDDDLFLQTVSERTAWTIAYAADPGATVRTAAASTVRDLLRQRMRHFSAGRFYRKHIQVLLGAYHAVNTILTAGFIAALVTSQASSGIPAFAAKIVADIVLLFFGGTFLRRHDAWALYLPMEFLYVLYHAIVGPLGVMSRPTWKPDLPGNAP